MSLPETDPNESVTMSGADLAILVGERDRYKAALRDIERTLEGHADILRGNSKVHYALMRARGALREDGQAG
jgi:hypothetical protein